MIQDRFHIQLPLLDDFRFVHEPLHASAHKRFVGRESEIEELVRRLEYSDSGSFLITGYRGVGKTSFVNRALSVLEKRVALLDVHLNLARPLQPAELMHLVIRHLYDRLIEKGWYDRLSPQAQTNLTLAYQRTSANVVRKLSESWDRGVEFGEIGLHGVKLPITPKFNMKRSRSVDFETSFLAYDDKTAEHDVIAISRALADGIYDRPDWWSRLLRLQRSRTRLKIVFVFDEMDKLDEYADSQKSDASALSTSAVEQMLGSLKNLFTTSGICFVFVAGKDLHEKWLKDLWRGDSVYESVFAYDKYLPCMWANVDSICDQLAPIQPGGVESADQLHLFGNLKQYLRFKGRGTPRRLLRAFNELVAWDGERPVIALRNEDLRRVTFFAQLNRTLESEEERLFGRFTEDTSGTRQDRRRLGVYYVVDWILRRDRSDFSASDLLTASRELSSRIALAEEIASGTIKELLDVLTESDYIQVVEAKLDDVLMGASSVSAERRYRLTNRRLAEMSGLVSSFEEEARSLQDAQVSGIGGPERIGRYELQSELGRGGMGLVYRAWDTSQNRVVALKVMHPWLAQDPKNRARFTREFGVLEKLRHENIVSFYEAGEADSQIYLAMELVDGVDLKLLIGCFGHLDPDAAFAILLPIARAIGYAHHQGFVRLDVKPNNIQISTTGRIYLMDLGIAKHAHVDNNITLTSDVLGTPLYMAPEQIKGRTTDQRSDIYSFGIVLYEAVAGTTPFSGSDLHDVMMQHIHEEPARPSSLVTTIPPWLDELILRCLRKDPDQRFQDAESLIAEVAANLPPDLFAGKGVDIAALVNGASARRNEFEYQRNAATVVLTRTMAAPRAAATVTQPMAPPPHDTLQMPQSAAMPKSASGWGIPIPLRRRKPKAKTAAAPAAPPPSPAYSPAPPPPSPAYAPAPQPSPVYSPAEPAPGSAYTPGPPRPWPPSPPTSAPAPSPYSTPPSATPTATFPKVEAPASAVPVVIDGPYLQWNSAADTPLTHVLSRSQVSTIGRAADNSISLSEGTGVSRYHASIEFKEDAFWLADLNTSNGSYLNGNRIFDARRLNQGDRIRIGTIEFTFHQ